MTQSDKNALNPALFAIYLDEIGWSPRQVAYILEMNERTVWRFMNGQNDPPENVMAWLMKLANFHSTYPSPEGWMTHTEKNS